jgi:hypothetical protein
MQNTRSQETLKQILEQVEAISGQSTALKNDESIREGLGLPNGKSFLAGNLFCLTQT